MTLREKLERVKRGTVDSRSDGHWIIRLTSKEAEALIDVALAALKDHEESCFGEGVSDETQEALKRLEETMG